MLPVAAIAGGLDAVANLASTAMTNKANMKLAEYQYSKEKEMWEAQNAYNAPSAQMGRLAEAGLNPNLMYGQGTVGNATQLPRYQAPTMQAPHFTVASDTLNALREFQDIQVRQAQVDNVKAATDVARQDLINKAAGLNQIVANTNLTNVRASTAQQLQATQLDVLKQNLSNMKLQYAKLGADLTLYGPRRDVLEAQRKNLEWENQLHNFGVGSNDSLLSRMISTLGQKAFRLLLKTSTDKSWQKGVEPVLDLR